MGYTTLHTHTQDRVRASENGAKKRFRNAACPPGEAAGRGGEGGAGTHDALVVGSLVFLIHIWEILILLLFHSSGMEDRLNYYSSSQRVVPL